ncbi:SDR family NAD(P)-dependent oxidoreductase [Streptomyces xiaopingdaonensis]|uniref:SDR family NAD(P)-dependent oxidoreductase n=1 Tax=Streptomyces xiaopingdaonensis TaxID=1565415 RepID=UPI000314D40F|nr:SDR family oxidoreductase [Streptomyces xiaopingdaonensis]
MDAIRHTLVTGAAGGIGAAVAREFAAHPAGADGVLTLVDVAPERLDEAAEAVRAVAAESGTPCTVEVHAADLASADGPAAAVRAAWEAHGPVDVLVNAAGRYPSTDMLDVTAESWDALQALNTRAPVLATAELGRRAVAAGRPASVVNISSGAALRARPGGGPYATSKAALEMATRAAALELGPHGIRVNAVSPGFVPVASEVNPVAPEYAEAVSVNPLGRAGTPDDVARAVRWIAGPDAAWVTGEVLRVDGGSAAGACGLPRLWPPRPTTHAADGAPPEDAAPEPRTTKGTPA